MILASHGENADDNGLSRKLAQQGSQFRALAALKSATALVLLAGGSCYRGEDFSLSNAKRMKTLSHPFTVHMLRFRMVSRHSMNRFGLAVVGLIDLRVGSVHDDQDSQCKQ